MKIALLGDTALYGKFSLENSSIFEYFKPIKETLESYDHIIVNLETPFNLNSKPNGYKSAYISSNPKNIELLRYLGVTIVNLANNHIFDFGIDAYNLTKKMLKDNNIDYFGIEGKNVLVEKGGNKISFNGFCCYSTNPLGLGEQGINALYYNDAEAVLRKNRELGYNTILSIHAGQEHINYPNYDHVKFARKLSQITPYVYYGHHPHVLQGIESFKDTLIAYSLGNFCFDDIYTHKSSKPLVEQDENNKSSIILEVEFQNNKLVGHKAIPIYAGKQKLELGNEAILKKLKEYSSKLQMEESAYNEMRNEIRTAINQQWASKRDLTWILRRLNLRTLHIVKDLYLNKRQYRSKFKNHL